MSHAEASLAARDLMDFSMQGTWKTIRFLSQTVPFFNARLQGMYKLGRGMKDAPGRFAAVTMATALLSVGLLLAYKDDEDWQKREDWDRDNFWWFKIGGVGYRIPKPFEVGALGTLAERGMETFVSDEMTGKRFMERAGALLWHNLSMNPVPQAFKPITDIYANKDSFRDRPIETMGMERLEPEYRYTQNTSMLGRGLSTGTGGAFSPVQYDHMIQAYFGWLGSVALGASDIVARPFTDEPVKPSRDKLKLLTGGFAYQLEDGPSRYVTAIYNQLKEVESAYATFNELDRRGRFDEADAYLEKNLEKIDRYEILSEVRQEMTEINREIRTIEQEDLDADEKRSLIRELQQYKHELGREVYQP
jgi:hypothetical protein